MVKYDCGLGVPPERSPRPADVFCAAACRRKRSGKMPKQRFARTALFVALLSARFTYATDIEGVQPAALDQPRVNIHLRRDPKGTPLQAGKDAENTINIQAFLDTGASGVLLSA